MKRRINSKSKKSKPTKTESSSTSMAAEQDIAVLLTTLVQKLSSFEMKIDTVLSRIPSQPLEVARKEQEATSLINRRRELMHTHKAICADCEQDCEVPFKPSSNRPVYCRACYAIRKSRAISKPREERKSNEVTMISDRLAERLKLNQPINPPKKKKPAVKKRTNKPARSPKKKKTAVKKKKKTSKKKKKR